MTIRWQALVLTLIILVSASVTRVNSNNKKAKALAEEKNSEVSLKSSADFAYERANVLESLNPRKGPLRNWEVLDPTVHSEALLVQSLDDQFPFFYYNTYKNWPIASITKFLSALVVLEDVGVNKKITIDKAAVLTEGEAGNLKEGEIYSAEDLLKIMLLTSSNDAATAFENFLGKDEFIRLLNKKARDIGMNETILFDASGLSPLNESSASDLMILARYLLQKNPEVFNWTRLSSFLVQPTNRTEGRLVLNINGLQERRDYLGGKTGTSDAAQENLLAIFSLNNRKVLMIILGSRNRLTEVDNLLNWVSRAYTF